MSEFTKEKFKMVAQQHELRMFNHSQYLLLDCNLMFDFNNDEKIVYAYGVIPIDLATEMYEAFKDVPRKTFSNTINHILENPLKIAKHPSIDIDRISYSAIQTGKDIYAILEEERNQALTDDYHNCYIDFSYIYSPEAFSWYIETVKSYYNRKKENNKIM